MSLDALLAPELARPAPDAVQAVVAEILRRHGDSVVAILFYGACRRTGDVTGLLDLYVLHDGHLAFHRRRAPAFLNRLLPPNVLSLTLSAAGRPIRAKVAVMSARQFARRMRPASWDTTVWARFSQPASLLYTRDPAARATVTAALAAGLRTAAHWALRLGPPSGPPSFYWQSLFAATYRAELRPEPSRQPALLYQSNAAWFDHVLLAALAGDPAVLITQTEGQTLLTRQAKPGGWLWRRLWAKPLNLLRLLKAAFTYTDGADYIAGKLARHAGVDLALTDWQRRHPILAAPRLLLRLRRLKATAPPKDSAPHR